MDVLSWVGIFLGFITFAVIVLVIMIAALYFKDLP